MVIARRSVGLSKTYVGLSVFLAIVGITVSILPAELATSSPGVTPPPIEFNLFFSLMALPLMTLPVLTLTTPVMLLFVYDKNNAVLEYLLSLGKDQADVFKAYLKASLFLGLVMLLVEIGVYIPLGLLLGRDLVTLLLVSLMVTVLGFSATSFVTIAMMAFSSLQKQRVGANQPLGTGVGVLLVMPSILIPLVFPGLAVIAELAYSSGALAVGLAALLAASRLIDREKLLP